MTITYSPAALELTEFVGTTGTVVTLTPDVNTVIYIASVTVSPNTSPPVSVSISNGATKSFTFSSKFPDMFDRVINYVVQLPDRKKQFKQVTRFVDLPDDYRGVYRYVPPSSDFKEITFTINLYSFTDELGSPVAPWGTGNPVGNQLYDSYKTTDTWVLDLRQNWESSQLALQEAVKRGSTYAVAAKKYPEIE